MTKKKETVLFMLNGSKGKEVYLSGDLPTHPFLLPMFAKYEKYLNAECSLELVFYNKVFIK